MLNDNDVGVCWTPFVSGRVFPCFTGPVVHLGVKAGWGLMRGGLGSGESGFQPAAYEENGRHQGHQ